MRDTADKSPLSRLRTGSPLFFSVLSIVFFLTDPLGYVGPVLAALFWLAGIAVLIVRWKKISRVHAITTIALLVILVLGAVPNW
jgi:intracellular septation protein A